MKELIIFSIIFLTPPSLFAQPTKHVKLGVNYSTFRNEEGKSKPGLTVGLGKDFYPIRSFDGFFGFELSYIRKKVTLENKTTPTNIDPKDSDVVIEDIKADIAYIDIPFKVGYTPIGRNGKCSFHVFGGFTISLPIKNHTVLKEKKIIFLEPDERGKYQFDYVIGGYEGTNISTNLLLGTRFTYEPLALTISYSRAQNNARGFTNLSVKDRIDSFYMVLAYAF